MIIKFVGESMRNHAVSAPLKSLDCPSAITDSNVLFLSRER
jgi:hypothetical protein